MQLWKRALQSNASAKLLEVKALYEQLRKTKLKKQSLASSGSWPRMLYMCYTHSYIRMYHHAFRSRRDAHVPAKIFISVSFIAFIRQKLTFLLVNNLQEKNGLPDSHAMTCVTCCLCDNYGRLI